MWDRRYGCRRVKPRDNVPPCTLTNGRYNDGIMMSKLHAGLNSITLYITLYIRPECHHIQPEKIRRPQLVDGGNYY